MATSELKEEARREEQDFNPDKPKVKLIPVQREDDPKVVYMIPKPTGPRLDPVRAGIGDE